MTSRTGKRWQRVRIASQIVFFLVFYFLLFHTGASLARGFSASPFFFYIDPLAALVVLITGQKLTAHFLLALIPLFLTLALGRFFCGWVCPFGSLQQAFTWLAERKKKKRSERAVASRGFRLKYAILIAVTVSALFGVQLAGWLDPFSLFTRSNAVVVLPGANYLAQQALKAGAGEKGIVAKTVKPLYQFSQKTILTRVQRTFAYSTLIGLILIAIIALNYYRRRFFCNYLCPLGALYGYLSRFSLMRLRVADPCKKCNACARNCTYYGGPFQEYLKSECLLCMNCVVDCPVSTVEFTLAWPRKTERMAVHLGRRGVLTALGGGLLAAALPGIAAERKYRNHRFVRPPGALKEAGFLDACVRCGECIQACPNNALHPAQLQAGLEGLWTPILIPANGFCDYECHRCTQVCPTGAIARLTLEEKKKFKMGTAVINRNLCYTYADGYNCAVCEEHCPVPEKAIRFREVEIWNFRGKLRQVRQIYVDPRLCIGCGTCEHVCPRTDQPAICVGAEEEQREMFL